MARTPDAGLAQTGDLGRILGPAREYWSAREPQERRRWIYTVLGLIVAAALLSYFLTRDPMTLVYRNLSPVAAGQVTQELGSLKIPYTLRGTSVYVPASMADQARVDLAQQGLPQQGQIGYSGVLQNLGIGMTDQQFSLAELNALQNDLATTVESINGVKSAVVNIVPAQQSVFVSQSGQQASAMVFVDLQAGVTLSPQQVLGIEDLVAHSVQGLQPSGVVVVDQAGNPLAAASAGSSQGDPVTGELGLQQSFEQNLNRQLMALLEPMVGPGNVLVQTNAQLDLTQTKSQSTIVQPLPSGQGVPISAHTIKETYSGTGTPQTPAGSGSNSVPTYPTASSGGKNQMSYTESTVNYDVTKINQTVTSQPFTLKGLTVSVMLNSRGYQLTATNRRAISQLIATAVGYANSGAATKDITILSAPFAKLPVPNFPAGSQTPPQWEIYAGAGALVLVLGTVLLLGRRRRRPSQRVQVQRLAPPPVPRDLAPDPRHEVIDRVRGMVGQNPEDAAQLVRGWLHEDSKDRARRRT